MRLHRFYTKDRVGSKKEVIISDIDQIHQITKVFRLKKRDSVIIFDGSGNDYICNITELGKKNLGLSIISSSLSRYIPSKDITLYMAITKKDTFEWIVEKATELGISRIVPMIAERSEKKALNMVRLNKIAIEASEQSFRGTVPIVCEITTLKSILEIKDALVLHTDAPLLNVGGRTSDFTNIFIGPEGGWSEDEIEMFHKRDFTIASIGRQILRAETAVVATLVKVMM